MDLSAEEVAFDTQNNDEVNFVKRDDQKNGIDLNVILVNLTELKMPPQYQHPHLRFAVTLPFLAIPRTVLITK